MRCILSLVLSIVLLAGCAAQNTAAGVQGGATGGTQVVAAGGSPVEGAAGSPGEEGSAEVSGETVSAEAKGEAASVDEAVEAASALDLPEDSENWELSDFAPALCEADAEEERYVIAEGTEWENTVVVRRGAHEGPSVYIVGGIHGDETAGWTAANLLKEVCPKTGTVYILSPANVYGAEHDKRTTRSDRDLNRNFPGNPEGWDAERIAASIYADVQERSPDLLLDLHETKGPQESAPERDDLRNAVIVNDVSQISDLVWELTVEGDLTLMGSPPAGSINRTVSEQLGIPAITLETWRGETLGERVARQIRFVEKVLAFYGML